MDYNYKESVGFLNIWISLDWFVSARFKSAACNSDRELKVFFLLELFIQQICKHNGALAADTHEPHDLLNLCGAMSSRSRSEWEEKKTSWVVARCCFFTQYKPTNHNSPDKNRFKVRLDRERVSDKLQWGSQTPNWHQLLTTRFPVHNFYVLSLFNASRTKLLKESSIHYAIQGWILFFIEQKTLLLRLAKLLKSQTAMLNKNQDVINKQDSK